MIVGLLGYTAALDQSYTTVPVSDLINAINAKETAMGGPSISARQGQLTSLIQTCSSSLTYLHVQPRAKPLLPSLLPRHPTTATLLLQLVHLRFPLVQVPPLLLLARQIRPSLAQR